MIRRALLALPLMLAAFGVAAPSSFAADTPTCLGQPATIVGTDGDDVISGTEGPDVIAALAGVDTVHALGGDDLVCLSEAGDRTGSLVGRGLDDLDTAHGGWGNDQLLGNATESRVFGNQGADQLSTLPDWEGYSEGNASPRFDAFGGWGDDVIHGSDDNQLEILRGGPGDDTIYGHEGGEGVLRGGQGDDRLEAGPDGAALIGDPLTKGYTAPYAGNDVLLGGAGVDLLIGMGGENTLDGGEDEDYCRDPGPGPQATECEHTVTEEVIWNWLF